MNLAYGVGIVCGFMLAFVLIVILFKFANKNGKMKTEYDERQESLRGVGYRYGFYSELIIIGILLILSAGEIELPFNDTLIYAFLIFAPIGVVCVINIWNGSYFGLNNDTRRYSIIFAVLGLFNAAMAIMATVNGAMIVDGEFGTPIINLFCAILLLAVGATIFLRDRIDKKEEEDDEE